MQILITLIKKKQDYDDVTYDGEVLADEVRSISKEKGFPGGCHFLFK